MADNVVREEVKVGLLVETAATWGTTPAVAADAVPAGGGLTTSDFIAVPMDPPEINEDAVVARDESIRGVLARDFESRLVRRGASGTLRGPFLPIETGYLLFAALGSQNAIVGALQNSTPTATGFRVHQMEVSRMPVPFSLIVQSPLGGGTPVAEEQQVYKGLVIPRFTIRFTSGEGWVTWEASVLGQGMTNPTAIANIIDYDIQFNINN